MDRAQCTIAWLMNALRASCLALVVLSFACAPAPSAPPTRAATNSAAPAPPAQPTAASAAGQPGAASAAAPSEPAARPEVVRVPVGYAGAVSDLPLFLAVERGYFRGLGLEVELIPFQAVAAMTAPLASGELLVGAGGVTAGLFNAMVRDIPIRIVADRNHAPVDYTGTGWVVRKDLLDSGQVRTPADLKGLTVGLGARAGTGETELDVLLRRGNLTFADIEVKELPSNLHVSAFANKSIDVAFTFEPYLSTIAEQDTGRLWMASGQVIPNHEQSVIIYSPVFGDRYPDAARNWMVAFVRGVRDYVRSFDGPELADDVVAAMVKYGNEKDPAKVRTLKMTPINPDGYPFKESLRSELEYFVRAGLVASPPDLDQIVDTRYVDYAIARLGRFDVSAR